MWNPRKVGYNLETLLMFLLILRFSIDEVHCTSLLQLDVLMYTHMLMVFAQDYKHQFLSKLTKMIPNTRQVLRSTMACGSLTAICGPFMYSIDSLQRAQFRVNSDPFHTVITVVPDP